MKTPSSVSGFKRALELWPYLFIAVSITGLAYISLNAVRRGNNLASFSEGQAYRLGLRSGLTVETWPSLTISALSSSFRAYYPVTLRGACHFARVKPRSHARAGRLASTGDGAWGQEAPDFFPQIPMSMCTG